MKRRTYHFRRHIAEALEARVLLSDYAFHSTASFAGGISGLDPSQGVSFDGLGNIFGSTYGGGASNDGTIFEIGANSSTITTLGSFNGANGAGPNRPAANPHYGTTYSGGANGDGTVYEIGSGATPIITLASFNGANGANPDAGLTVDIVGNLFGTTESGGDNNDGTVFEIAQGTSTITTIASFDGANGQSPRTSLSRDGLGDLFGTTYEGGASDDGTVFEIGRGSTAITTLVSFYGPNGANPLGSLQLDPSGDVYGTTYGGGADGEGTVFEIRGRTFTTIASFTGANGANPSGGTFHDNYFNIYGTTEFGGEDNLGTVYKIPYGASTVTTLVSFNSTNGAYPQTDLLTDNTGNYYGTTSQGGADNAGTVFELAAPPAKLAFNPTVATTAAGTILGGNFGVGVYVENSQGGVDNIDNSTVTLTLSGGTFAGGATTANATAVNGIARFTNLAIYDAGTYSLSATDGSLAKAVSSFTISPASYGLDSFGSFVPAPDGEDPTGVTIDANGNLFGTTSAGGIGYGTVFEIAQGSTTITTLVEFNQANGAYPDGGLVLDSGGDLFGTTEIGGAHYDGTVFEIAAGSTALTTVASFEYASGADPKGPLLLDASGNLYGTTSEGSSGGDGTIFEIMHGSFTISTLASFSSYGGGGGMPVGGLVLDVNGNLYGTTQHGGAKGDGVVFEVAHGTTSATTLVSFNGSNGSSPQAGLLLDPGGNIYGTTTLGGAANLGTVFEIAHGSTTLTTVVSFNGANGSYPTGLVLDSSGDLYGTTPGAVFEVGRGSMSTTAVASFGPVGAPGPLILDRNGNLFGATSGGSLSVDGTVFEIGHGTNTVTTLASFDEPNNGGNPYGGLIMDSTGNLFGTTSLGGVNNDGTIFEVPDGTTAITTLTSFDGIDGANPHGELIRDFAGNFYGTTQIGGAYNGGTVFEIANGSTAITVLASFKYATGSNPAAGLTIDAAGDLFGTAQYGGNSNDGTVFEIGNGTGVITVLASFNGENGAYPQAGVVLDSSGNLYGTTYDGGSGQGVVFELAHGSGTITSLASFSSTNNLPVVPSGLVLDPSGNLYGTTEFGNTYGTVFELAQGTTTLTTLFTFNQSGSSDPSSALVLDPAGNLFGTSGSTAFEIAQGSTAITTIASFNYGAFPSGLMRDSAGNLYGTTEQGGSANAGTVFELVSLPTSLAFSQPPAGTSAGASLGGANGIQVAVISSTGHFSLGDSSSVTLTLSDGVFSTGSSTATAAAVNGVATFSNLAIDTPGSYTVTATDGSLTPVTSAGFTITAPPPALVGSPVVNGDNPNGLFNAAGQPSAGAQRSMVEDVVYTFNQAVTIPDTNAAFTVVGTGANPGTAPTSLTAAAVPGSNGTQWAVTLTGADPGTLGSIANGEYSITINPAAVFSAADGTTQLAAGRTDRFYRLFGDVNGDETVNAADNLQLKKALTIYNPAFDSNADGTVNAADNLLFKKDLAVAYFGDGFVPTI